MITLNPGATKLGPNFGFFWKIIVDIFTNTANREHYLQQSFKRPSC